MQRRDFLKSIPMLAMSPVAMSKFGMVRREELRGPEGLDPKVHLPIGRKKKLIMAWSISGCVFGAPQYMSGGITRRPDGAWLLEASDGQMSTVQIGDQQRCRPGWSIWMVGHANHTLPEFLGDCEDRLRRYFPKCEVQAAVHTDGGCSYHVTRNPWIDLEFDILPEEDQ